MKRIVLVGLAASVPALAADRATVPLIRRAPGGAPPAATRTEGGVSKIRAPGAEIKRPELKEHKAGYGELKEHKVGYGELKEHKVGYGEHKAPSEHKSPAEFKEGKFRGDAAVPAELAPVQREAPVRY